MWCAGTTDGTPVASNNGLERDGETQRWTVNCSATTCKKRQCKALKLSFKNPGTMSEATLERITVLMKVSI